MKGDVLSGNRAITVVLAVLLSVLLMSFSLVPASAEPKYKARFVIGRASYEADGCMRAMDAVPFIENGRTFVPIRYLAYALGVPESNVLWDGKMKAVTLILQGVTVEMVIGSKTLLVNRDPVQMDTAPVIRDGSTYLPAKFVAEAFGFRVEWDAAVGAVLVFAPEEENQGLNACDRHWAVYYGYPSYVNGCGGDVDRAAKVFENFRVVVMAVWERTHPDYRKTVQIIERLRGKTDFYGYVPLGRAGFTGETKELSLEEIKARVDSYFEMGCRGVFCDEAGNDYGVGDELRNAVGRYIHSKGMRVIWNAWEPVDLANMACWQDGDGWCAESFLVKNGVFTDGKDEYRKYKDIRDIETKKKVDIRVYVLSTETAGHKEFSSAESLKKQMYAWWGVLLYGYDYFQYTDMWHSASNNYLYCFRQPTDYIGRRYLAEPSHSGTEYKRNTDEGILHLDGRSYRGWFEKTGQ
ncbi:copper amine oxidase N-terminal domain-containing protein [Desulfofundulus sp. TPOSR]|uniref:copper amine oxidase N-terminal domain-containing protein n=1 Tax=Desulfofundulus sp. TPOSR TaxID=2714340 RepID=UPI00140721DB|nr:copper amine oxidase N-terminal domain-containing protein [Desulfofundulus sp. TPOSR]NHM28135.1 copper amine oxidase N-terminal domain-containing protein [Desulfofundulus sp. TPOSR]